LLFSVTNVGIVSDGSAGMRKLNTWLSGLPPKVESGVPILLLLLTLPAFFCAPLLLFSVTSVGIVSDGSADMRKLNTWLSGLLQERGPDLFRSKGILAIHGSDDK
jgi:hypothetical protein